MSTIRGEVTTVMREEFARISGGPPLAFTIKEFCRAHRLSVSSYYELRKKGLGPQEKRVNTHVIITREAARAWREGANNLITT
jgi:hypothetical protein